MGFAKLGVSERGRCAISGRPICHSAVELSAQRDGTNETIAGIVAWPHMIAGASRLMELWRATTTLVLLADGWRGLEMVLTPSRFREELAKRLFETAFCAGADD